VTLRPRLLAAAWTRARLGVALVIALALGLAAYSVRESIRVFHMRQELGALERDVEALTARQKQLEAQAERLRSDPAYIEKLAREQMGMVRPGDTVLKFPSQPK
jgi:cell division protein FtsB